MNRRLDFITGIASVPILLAATAKTAHAAALPRLEADTLGGKHVVLPDDANGRPIVLVLGFARESEDALVRWSRALNDAVGKRAQLYVVIVADSAPFFASRGKIEKKIASSALASQAELDNDVLVTFQGAGWRDLIPQGGAPRDAGVVVTDGGGNVVYAKRQPFAPGALADAESAVPR